MALVIFQQEIQFPVKASNIKSEQKPFHISLSQNRFHDSCFKFIYIEQQPISQANFLAKKLSRPAEKGMVYFSKK